MLLHVELDFGQLDTLAAELDLLVLPPDKDGLAVAVGIETY
jgi:hypothetical protein